LVMGGEALGHARWSSPLRSPLGRDTFLSRAGRTLKSELNLWGDTGFILGDDGGSASQELILGRRGLGPS
jgi:hypothetical protein